MHILIRGEIITKSVENSKGLTGANKSKICPILDHVTLKKPKSKSYQFTKSDLFDYFEKLASSRADNDQYTEFDYQQKVEIEELEQNYRSDSQRSVHL